MGVEQSVVINAPPEKIFSVLSDVGQAQQWMPAIKRIEQISPGPFGVGTNWKESRMVGNRMMDSTIKVAGYQPPTNLKLDVQGKGITGHLEFILTPQGTATTVLYQGEMKGHGFMALFNGRINKMMAEGAPELVGDLKRYVESKT
ncbi:MAG: SRPBCC family protein [Thermoplasmata archaeon]|nr:SRPBCC family protein [Thermoplasmata archaeon]